MARSRDQRSVKTIPQRPAPVHISSGGQSAHGQSPQPKLQPLPGWGSIKCARKISRTSVPASILGSGDDWFSPLAVAGSLDLDGCNQPEAVTRRSVLQRLLSVKFGW